MFAAITFLLVGSFHSPCDSSHPKSASGIRAIDFCNFDYPGVNYTEEIGSSQEISASKSDLVKELTASFTLRDGFRPASEEGDLITLDEIKYVKVTHDGREAAILCLADHSGGTMITDFLYVWSTKDSKPVLLWSYPLGERAYLGLYRVYARQGDLILELNDPDFREGDCCSSRFIRLRYHWTGSKFQQVAKARFEKRANRPVQTLDLEKPQILRNLHELTVSSQIRYAGLSDADRDAIARIVFSDADSKECLQEHNLSPKKAIGDFRIQRVRLSHSDHEQFLIQGWAPCDCGAVGNCSVLVLQREPGGFRILLDDGGFQDFSVEDGRTNGYRDLRFTSHDSAASQDLMTYRFDGRRYRCQSAYLWTTGTMDHRENSKRPPFRA